MLNRLALTVVLSGWAIASSAGPNADSAFTAFTAFKGELGPTPLIGAGADHALAAGVFRPIPATPITDINVDKFRLGFDLFHETRLSRDNTLSCMSCHNPANGGDDGLALPRGIDSAQGSLSAPTILNSALNFRQHWDGSVLNQAQQAIKPIDNPIELGHSLDAVLQMLAQDERYARDFAQIYPDGVTALNLGDALAHYQEKNYTLTRSPFLDFLNGDTAQLGPREQRGMERFQAVGCASCHNGINLGGNSYQPLGAAKAYYDESRPPLEADNGVFGRSRRDTDRHLFKVPTLHNISETAPYLHNGSIGTLEEVIDLMGVYQLGRQLNQQDIDDIALFLRTLGGLEGRGHRDQPR